MAACMLLEVGTRGGGTLAKCEVVLAIRVSIGSMPWGGSVVGS